MGSTDPPSYLAEYDQLTLARLLVAQGRAPEAVEMLDRLLHAAQHAGRQGSVVEVRIVRAHALHANGETETAAADLTAALADGVATRAWPSATSPPAPWSPCSSSSGS